jgi:hypothetical protein
MQSRVMSLVEVATLSLIGSSSRSSMTGWSLLKWKRAFSTGLQAPYSKIETFKRLPL